MSISYRDLNLFQQLLRLPDSDNDWSKLELFHAKNISGRYGLREIDEKSTAVIWFDGSNQLIDWMKNIRFGLRAYSEIPFTDEDDSDDWSQENPHKVHSGFYEMYATTEFKEIVREDFKSLINSSRSNNIIFAGYSLGAAMAQLGIRDFKHHYKDSNPIPYLFASPRVGNAAYVDSFLKHIQVGYRIVNKYDIARMLPFWLWGYRHPYHETYLGLSPRVVPRFSTKDHLRESYLKTLNDLNQASP